MSLPARFRYYFRKKFLADDVNELQDNLQIQNERLLTKRAVKGAIGPVQGVVVGAGFTVSITSNNGSEVFQGFDADGKFTALSTEPLVTDDLSVPARPGGSFTLPGGGNEKWLTLVMRFDLVLSQPEVEKLTFTTVNFRETESFIVGVIEGVEAGAGTAVKPSLASEDGIYLADILIDSAAVDFTTNPPVVDVTRLTRDPLAEATDRGLDAVASLLALQGGTNGIRMQDLRAANAPNDFTEDFEDAALGAQVAGADVVDRVAILSDIIATTFQALSGAYSHVGPTTSNAISVTVPVGTTFILGFVKDTSAFAMFNSFFLINVTADDIVGSYTDEVGALGGSNSATYSSLNLSAALPFVIGTHLFDVSTVRISAYAGAGATITIQVVTGGVNVHSGSVDLFFL